MLKCDAAKDRECIWIRKQDKDAACVGCPVWDPDYALGGELEKALRPLVKKGEGEILKALENLAKHVDKTRRGPSSDPTWDKTSALLDDAWAVINKAKGAEYPSVKKAAARRISARAKAQAAKKAGRG